MSRHKLKITKERVEDLLINKGLSTTKAAEAIGCDPTTVYRRAREFGIDLSDRRCHKDFATRKPGTISLHAHGVHHYDYRPDAIPECYLKEARAMLQGKHTAFKNKCTKLVGDEP